MSLSCPFCQTTTRYRSTENVTYVYEGKPVCQRDECRQKAIAAIQGVQLALQLGIGRRPEAFQLPLHLEGG